MKNFNRGNKFQSRGRGDQEERRMHSATCDDCGRACEVPFKPTGNRPVYCNNCFDKGDSGFKSERSERGGRNDRGDRRDGPTMHRATCDDCGRSCEVPFKPTAGKSVYCKNCYGKGEGSEKSFEKRDNFGKAFQPDQSSKKHDEINSKLDRILSLLQNMKPVHEAKEVKAEIVKPLKVEKKVEKVAPKKESKAKTTPVKKAVKAVKKGSVKKK